jgi:hypothetical protein
MAATVTVEHLTGTSPVLAIPITLGMRFRSDDASTFDNTAPVSLPAKKSTNLTAPVAASNSPATVTLLDVTGLEVGQTLLVSPGQATQEAVLISAVGSGTVTAIFQRAHITGAQVVLVTASFSKTLQTRVITAPPKAISKVRFWRNKNLPTGVYDQYRFTNSYTPANNTPWTSASGVNYLPAPTTTEEIFAPGPFRTVGVILPYLELQWLYTGSSAGPLDSSSIRIAWDES